MPEIEYLGPNIEYVGPLEDKGANIEYLGPLDKKPSGAGGSFEKEPYKQDFWKKAIKFTTGGHIHWDWENPPPLEVERDPETGEITKVNPMSARMGFFEDPITAASFGAVGAVKYVGPLASKAMHGAREALGWFTAGVSEVPSLGTKGATALAKGLSAKPLEKTMAGAVKTAEKGLGVKPIVQVTRTGPGAAVVKPLGEMYRDVGKVTPATKDISPTPEGLSYSQIVDDIKKGFDIPIRTGRHRKLTSGKALGIYKVKPEVIRLKYANDVEVATHELGHHIQKVLGYPKTMPTDVQQMAYPGAKDKSAEGFAEFLRTYLTNRTDAKTMAPNYFNEFEASLKGHPEVKSIFNSITDKWEALQKLSTTQKVMSFVKSGDEVKTKVIPTFEAMYSKVVDENHPIKALTDYADQIGKGKAITEDPYKLAWLTRGWAKKAEQFIEYKPFLETDTGIEFTGKSLKKILEPVKDPNLRKSLDTYLFARRAMSDPRIIKGFKGKLTKDDFRQVVSEGKKDFTPIANELYEYQNTLLKHLVDSGRISEASKTIIQQRNSFYAPLYRVIDGMERTISGGKSVSDIPKGIFRLKGSAYDVYSPTENILYNTYALLNIAERNRVGRAVADMSKIEGIGKIIEKVPRRVKPIKISATEAERYGVDLVDNLSGDFLEGMTVFKPTRLGKNEVLFYRNGKPETYHIGDPDLYKAINAMDSESIGTILRLLSYPAKWLRTGATLSPEFIMRNPFRDQMTAFAYSNYGYKPFWDLGKGLFHVLKKDKTYQLFNSSGAAHAALVSLDRNYLSKSLNDILKDPQIRDVVKNPLRSFQVLSELMEEGTRVGEFARALKKEGMGKEGLMKAGIAARDVTLDFQRIGSKTKAYNAITAFANAQIQGIDKGVRAFKDYPVRTTLKVAGGITLPSLLLWNVNKDDPYYQELPDWRKTLCWNFVFHNKDGSLKRVISLPKPFELGILFGTLPEMALNWAYSKDTEGMTEAVSILIESFMPGILPTASVSLIENYANKSMFFDRKIVPRGKEGLSEELQYGPRTTEIMKLVGKGVSKVPFLEKFSSPAKIENVVRGWTGNLGYLTLSASDKILKSLDIVKTPPEPSMTLSDIPGIRGFAVRFPSASARSIELFYNKYSRLQKEWDSKKEELGIRGYGLTSKDLKKAGIEKPFGLEDMRKTAESLSTLRKVINITYKSYFPSKEKREALNKQYMLMINTARRALGKEFINQ